MKHPVFTNVLSMNLKHRCKAFCMKTSAKQYHMLHKWGFYSLIKT